ncbi:MAG: trehalose-phosphatase [Candidatus Solincola sediminis]|uniref:Trehalose 6-phosphate phosphatase n=1 Tax=Candidatus Solincola sediminis TaxID=1797199 RepID=A0A1F2WLI1_9ACTN|nr:MAG: trehalose-phosphatase [Candidatus Solincola sediminis]OFW58587.1 MAG: trehalose-phosphatase [Candidatus Solincola sediminis]
MDNWIGEFKKDPRHSGIFLDFDGTISDIAPKPGIAQLHPRAAHILPSLATRYPLCVLSGRRAANVAEIVGLPHIHYIGVHGMEWLEDEPKIDPEILPFLPRLDRARQKLQSELDELPGVTVEDKMLTLGLHYREAPEQEDKALDLAQKLADTLGLKVRRGRKVVELRAPVDVDKGTALGRLSHAWRLKRALYAGDDLTDVDAFRGLRRLIREGGFEGTAIAVLSDETPIELEAVADITVLGVDGLLDILAQL